MLPVMKTDSVLQLFLKAGSGYSGSLDLDFQSTLLETDVRFDNIVINIHYTAQVRF